MSLKIRVFVTALLLTLVIATTVQASFDEGADWHWYSDGTYTTVVGWRYQDCYWARWWGDETNYVIYNHLYWCD
jgi:hypothetical protein